MRFDLWVTAGWFRAVSPASPVVKASSRAVHGERRSAAYDGAMEPTRDEPLPATLAFVFWLGGLILVGWFAMYLLLRARW